MSVIYVALPVALLLGAAGMYACIRCICDGQYEDLETPPIRILLEDRKSIEHDEKLSEVS